MGINLHNISYRYDQRKTDGVQNLSFEIPSHKITALVGPSGSGKTTTLKCLAGKILPQQGEIIYPGEFKIAYVDQTPQHTHLERTVFESLDLLLKTEVSNEDKRANQIRSTLALLSLTNEIDSRIEQLSGGQKQRYIIAKALVLNPTFLLLDEPFANLDQNLRIELLEELFELFKEQEITVVWVTHNTQEALAYSDHLALLNYGNLQQVGTPQQLYYAPENLFTAQFFGQVNLVPGKLVADEENEITVNFFNDDFIIPRPKNFRPSASQDILMIIHPEHILISHEGYHKALIIQKIFKGSRTLLKLDFKGTHLYAETDSLKLLPYEKVRFDFNVKHLYCLGEI